MNILLNELRDWYHSELSQCFSNCWVFGSTIYRDGALFDDQSDVDLVVIVPVSDGPAAQFALVDQLQQSVFQLERRLLALLARNDASKSIVSLIPATELELEFDIHKSGRPFFGDNMFYSLRDGCTSPVTQSESPAPKISAALSQAIAECQGYRNRYVACSANGSKKESQFDSTDVFPKPLARAAAGVADYLRPKAGVNRFDLNEGTLHLLSLLNDLFESSPQVAVLRDMCSRRVNRGGKPLSPADIALLHELLAWQAASLIAKEVYPVKMQSTVAEELQVPSSKTVIDEGYGERVAWLLPRGVILVEDITYDSNPSWAIVSNYYDFANGWQGGTHFHDSYATDWGTHERSRSQLHKLAVPIGDWEYAKGALRLMEVLRSHNQAYSVSELIAAFPGGQVCCRYFQSGSPVVIEDLDRPFSNLKIPPGFRDVLAEAEDLLLLWDGPRVEEYVKSALHGLRQRALVEAEGMLGRDATALKFVAEVIDQFNAEGTANDLKKWTLDLHRSLGLCLSVARR